MPRSRLDYALHSLLNNAESIKKKISNLCKETKFHTYCSYIAGEDEEEEANLLVYGKLQNDLLEDLDDEDDDLPEGAFARFVASEAKPYLYRIKHYGEKEHREVLIFNTSNYQNFRSYHLVYGSLNLKKFKKNEALYCPLGVDQFLPIYDPYFG